MPGGPTTEDSGASRYSLCFCVSPVVNNLLPRSACRNLEVHAAVVIGFACGGEIEVGEENLVGAARAEVKQSIAHDGVIDHVGLMAVFENEHRRRLSGHALFRLARSWFGGSVGFPPEPSRIGAFHGRLCVLRARSADVVGVSGVIVAFLVVGDLVRNRVWNVGRLAEAEGK